MQSNNKDPPDDQKKNNDDKHNNNDDKSIPSMLAKAIMWMFTGYMLITIISLMFPGGNQPEIVRLLLCFSSFHLFFMLIIMYHLFRYVSWTEFLHHMLAKGEVAEIIVRPDVDIVTIVLHPGAVIKGRRIDHRTFHMNIIDTNKFEEKLRAAEQRLGISAGQGVPIVYERTDTAGRLLTTLIAAAIVISIISRMKFKSPSSMDAFVYYDNIISSFKKIFH